MSDVVNYLLISNVIIGLLGYPLAFLVRLDSSKAIGSLIKNSGIITRDTCSQCKDMVLHLKVDEFYTYSNTVLFH